MTFSMGIPHLGGALSSGSPAAPAEDEPNPNLLLWSEEMQQAEWTVTGGVVTVTADAGADPLAGATADRLAFGGTGAGIGQTSTTAASTGAAALVTINLTSSYQRVSLSGTFDGTLYLLSLYVIDEGGGGSELQLRLERVGGFLRGGLRDTGDSPTVRVWGWKLETPDLTDYVKREGV